MQTCASGGLLFAAIWVSRSRSSTPSMGIQALPSLAFRPLGLGVGIGAAMRPLIRIEVVRAVWEC